MLPLSEFCFSNFGTLQGTYCKRCRNILHRLYTQDRRKDQRGPSLQQQLNEANQCISDLRAQIAELQGHINTYEAQQTA